MSALDPLVQNALRDPFDTARRFANSGGQVIGYVGADIPVELIMASHAHPLPLFGSAAIPTPLADRYLEPTFSPAVRSIAEQYLQGSLDFIDAVIFPRSDDSAQRLYYYLSELRTRGVVNERGPKLMIYDLAKIPRKTSSEHSRAATRRLAEELGVDVRELPAAISRRNRRRELFAAAAVARMGSGGLRGSVMDRIFRAADLCDADTFDAAFASWLERLEPQAGGPPVLLAGSAPPDERLHQAVETAGGNIVCELGDHASCSVRLNPIDPHGACMAIADHYQTNPRGSRAFVDRAALTAATARRTAVRGVLIWLIEQEDGLIWDLPAQLAALRHAGIATLSLVRRRWESDDATITEIAEFTRNLAVSA
jgi:hypothetical protein